jgi:hypothetical protein
VGQADLDSTDRLSSSSRGERAIDVAEKPVGSPRLTGYEDAFSRTLAERDILGDCSHVLNRRLAHYSPNDGESKLAALPA